MTRLIDVLIWSNMKVIIDLVMGLLFLNVHILIHVLVNILEHGMYKYTMKIIKTVASGWGKWNKDGSWTGGGARARVTHVVGKNS